MGSDLHAYIEFRHRADKPWATGQWSGWSDVVLRWNRSDDLFSALSGMRKQAGFEELIPARGFPEDAAGDSFGAMHYFIFEDEGYDPDRYRSYRYFLRSEVKPEWRLVKRGEMDFVWGPGVFHGHSHLTLEEIHGCLAHAGLELGKTDVFFQVVVATMEKLGEVYETRLVFWYD